MALNEKFSIFRYRW